MDNSAHNPLLFMPNRANMCTTKSKEANPMKIKFYLNGKKTTRKAIKDLIGEERLNRYIEESKEAYRNDPYEQNSYFLGSNGCLTIELEF